MNEVLKKLGEIGIIPVVVLDDAKDARRNRYHPGRSS